MKINDEPTMIYGCSVYLVVLWFINLVIWYI